MAAAEKPNQGQQVLKAIWATAHELGLTTDNVHDVVYREVGKEGLRQCSAPELHKVLDALKLHVKMSKELTGRISDKQLSYIRGLEKQLGWSDDPKRLQGFVKKFAKVDDVKWLTAKQASKIIEGMKKIVDRDKERIGENGDCKEKRQ